MCILMMEWYVDLVVVYLRYVDFGFVVVIGYLMGSQIVVEFVVWYLFFVEGVVLVGLIVNKVVCNIGVQVWYLLIDFIGECFFVIWCGV